MHFIDWNAFWFTGLVSFYPGAVKSESPERGTGRTDQACKSGAVTLCLRRSEWSQNVISSRYSSGMDRRQIS